MLKRGGVPLRQGWTGGAQEHKEGQCHHDVTEEEHATDALHDGAEHRHGTGIGVTEGQAPKQGVAAANDPQIGPPRSAGHRPHRHDDGDRHQDDFLNSRGHLRLLRGEVTPCGAEVPRSEGQGQHLPPCEHTCGPTVVGAPSTSFCGEELPRHQESGQATGQHQLVQQHVEKPHRC